ncbi:CBS domain-containing protein [Myceligenerans cantabricum]
MATQTVSDFMTPAPTTVDVDDSVQVAAQAMSADDIGAVLVEEGDRVAGLVTDRDLAVRGIAAGRGPEASVRSVMSDRLVAVGPHDTVDAAVRVIRDAAVRRVPVMDGENAVGIVSLGDLAMALDPRSALSDVSSAEPNR